MGMRALRILKQPTKRDGLNAFFEDISKCDVLTITQEVALSKIIKGKLLTSEEEDSLRDIVNGKQYRDIFVIKKKEELTNALDGDTGDIKEGCGNNLGITKQQAIHVLTKCNLRFVVSVAKQYEQNKPGASLQDLINEGSIGLTKAAKRFDETRGFKFISYGVWWIRQSILHSLAQNATIRLPANQKVLMDKIWKYESAFLQKKGYLPTKEDIIENFDITEDQYENYLNAYFTLETPSLDNTLSTDNDKTLGETVQNTTYLSPDQNIIEEAQRDLIKKAMEQLKNKKQTERQGEILLLLSGLNPEGIEYNTREIADKLGIPEGSVKQSLRSGRRNLARILGVDTHQNKKSKDSELLDDDIDIESRKDRLTLALEQLKKYKKTKAQFYVFSLYSGLNPTGRPYSITEITKMTNREEQAVNQTLNGAKKNLINMLGIDSSMMKKILKGLIDSCKNTQEILLDS